MQYSLSSRFRGTLVGAVIGEMLESSSNTTKHFSYPNTTKPDDRGQLLHNRESKLPVITLPGRLAVLGAKSLIRLGRFDLDDWRDACSEDLASTKVYGILW
jgi:hypothetical protein